MIRQFHVIPPAPRSMQAAFGPYTDHALHPMPDRPSAHPAEWVTVAIGAVLALVWLSDRCGWINFTGA